MTRQGGVSSRHRLVDTLRTTRPLVPRIVPLFALVLALSGCAAQGDGLTVFAAASLTDALQPLGQGFRERTGVPVRFSFGGSTTLAQQLARGAPADLFIAAGPTPMELLEGRQLLLEDSRRTLLTNSLVLVARRDGISDLAAPDLLSDRVSRVALADPALAPAGVYSQAALESLGLWEALQPKLVLGLDVRTVLAYVERGEADVGLVYATEAVGREGLRVLFTVPPAAHPQVQYPIAVLRGSGRQRAAREFIAYLESPEALAVFEGQGWRAAPAGDAPPG